MTSAYPPLVQCTLGTVGKSSQDFSGLDIDLIKKVITAMNWTDSQWDFECVNYDSWQGLAQNTTLYLGFAGSLVQDYQMVNDNILFSIPYWTTGLSVLVYDYESEWQFLYILTGEILVLVILSLFLGGVVTFFLERKQYSLETYIWNSFTNFFFIQSVSLKRVSSKMIQFFSWFMVFFVIQYWISQNTAISSIHKMDNNLNSHYNLIGKRVKSSLNYRETVYSLGAKWVDPKYGAPGEYDALPENTIQKNLVLRDLSRQDPYQIDAYILDDSFANIVQTSECKLKMQKRLFKRFSYSFGFDVSQNSTLISNVNYAIQTLLNSNFAEKELKNYIQTSVTPCEKRNYESIIPFHVSGVFLIQGIAIAVGFVLWIFTQLPIYPKLQGLMEKWKVFQIQEEDSKLLGDDLSIQNLKDTNQRIFKKFQNEVAERLDEMDESITVFYENLLTEEIRRKAQLIRQHQGEIENIIEKHDKSLSGTKDKIYGKDLGRGKSPMEMEEIKSEEEENNLYSNQKKKKPDVEESRQILQQQVNKNLYPSSSEKEVSKQLKFGTNKKKPRSEDEDEEEQESENENESEEDQDEEIIENNKFNQFRHKNQSDQEDEEDFDRNKNNFPNQKGNLQQQKAFANKLEQNSDEEEQDSDEPKIQNNKIKNSNDSEESLDSQGDQSPQIIQNKKQNISPIKKQNQNKNQEQFDMQESFGIKNVVVNDNLSDSDN